VSATRTVAWEEVSIADVAEFGSGDIISVASLSGQSSAYPIPVFGGNGIAGFTSRSMVSDRTVILGRVGQRCGAVYLNDGPAWITDNAMYARKFKRPVDVDFFALVLEAANLNGVKNRNDLPLITQAILRDVRLWIPTSVREQRRLARVVATVDSQISAMRQLLEKKRAIKQGMMQELLTGRTRLAGFTEAWSTRKLSALGNFLRGRGVKRDDVRPFGVPCIRYGELYTTYTDYTTTTVSFVDAAVAGTALPIRTGDILFAGSGETKEEIGMSVAYVGDAAAVAGGDIIVLRGSEFDAVYLSSLLNTPEVASQKARGGQGDAVVHINWRVLAGLEVTVPALPEQQAIAEVLRDADAEVGALERRLDAARAIREGMMQELLTGRTRLVPTEAPA
jgi:type I restriction enzyme S subunit